jgi:hypothetical protein
MAERRRPRRARGAAGYPDRVADATGAAPAASALTLRMALALFGLILFAVTSAIFIYYDLPVALIVTSVVLALVAAVDIVVIARRKHGQRAGG